jgi:hypothetical protein
LPFVLSRSITLIESKENQNMQILLVGLSAFFMISGVVQAAGNADVLKAQARSTGPGVWSFSVTVSHPDSGWEDYADGWDVVLPDGTVIKPAPNEAFTRTLWHPHVNEQPFTRSQGGIEIPADVKEVMIRAHDKPDGFGGKTVSVRLP